METFEHGWSKETTYDTYRDRALLLIDHAAAEGTPDPLGKACMEAALVFLVSGLEALICLVLKPAARTDIPYQSLAVYQQRLRQHDAEYEPINDGRVRTAIDRLFQVRHAIIHAGSQVTDHVTAAANRSYVRGAGLNFQIDDIKRLVEACDDFASRMAALDSGNG